MKDMTSSTSTITLRNSQIGIGHPAYIIAELACAHEGDFEFAVHQIDAAIRAGASAVKFQVFTADGLVVPSHELHAAYKRFQFSTEQWCRLSDIARVGGLHVLIDVFEPWSLEVANLVDAEGVKVHSSNVTNPHFLEQVAQNGRPIFIGVGGTTEAEIHAAVQILRKHDVPFALIHGFQGYPTTTNDSHLSRVSTMAKDFGVPIGYAGHADGAGDAQLWQNILALGLGCSFLENHLTLDRSSERTDYHASLMPVDFQRMVTILREMESALGNSSYELSKAELRYRSTFKTFIVSNHNLDAGHRLQLGDFAFKRANSGILPTEAGKLLGRELRKAVTKDTPLTENLLV